MKVFAKSQDFPSNILHISLKTSYVNLMMVLKVGGTSESESLHPLRTIDVQKKKKNWQYPNHQIRFMWSRTFNL